MKYINYDARSKKTPKQQALSHTQSKFGCPLDTVNRLRQQGKSSSVRDIFVCSTERAESLSSSPCPRHQTKLLVVGRQLTLAERTALSWSTGVYLSRIRCTLCLMLKCRRVRALGWTFTRTVECCITCSPSQFVCGIHQVLTTLLQLIELFVPECI